VLCCLLDFAVFLPKSPDLCFMPHSQSVEVWIKKRKSYLWLERGNTELLCKPIDRRTLLLRIQFMGSIDHLPPRFLYIPCRWSRGRLFFWLGLGLWFGRRRRNMLGSVFCSSLEEIQRGLADL
jgi:hypothetical protein